MHGLPRGNIVPGTILMKWELNKCLTRDFTEMDIIKVGDRKKLWDERQAECRPEISGESVANPARLRGGQRSIPWYSIWPRFPPT
jgi:hypothetical protein